MGPKPLLPAEIFGAAPAGAIGATLARMAGRRRGPVTVATLAAGVIALAGCGRGSEEDAGNGSARAVPDAPAIPVSATKNTSRVPGDSPVDLAAGSARAVYPGGGQRPPAIALADAGSWPATLAAASLMAAPLKAPLLLTDGSEVPDATFQAIEELSPTTGKVLRLGAAGSPDGVETVAIGGDDPYTLAANVDAYRARLTGRWSRSVVVAPVDSPAYAMPAAAWAAKSGDPVLFTGKDELPAATARAIRSHGKPKIYLLGPASVVSAGVASQLEELGSLTRIGGPNAAASAVAFARFSGSGFGWGVTDPGHGFQFADPGQPAAAGAAAPLAASGSYGPLLVINRDGSLPGVVREYLRDVRPGYSSDPVRGVYNRGWMIGNTDAVPAATQAEIDGLLEIKPVR
jgi:hypothetical protein